MALVAPLRSSAVVYRGIRSPWWRWKVWCEVEVLDFGFGFGFGVGVGWGGARGTRCLKIFGGFWRWSHTSGIHIDFGGLVNIELELELVRAGTITMRHKDIVTQCKPKFCQSAAQPVLFLFLSIIAKGEVAPEKK